MPRQTLCRLGLAQLSVNPAYADQLVTDIQEPTFPGKDDRIGLFTLAGIEEINALRQRISERYLTHLSRKLEATIRFAGARGVELLLLPEYSVPPQLLALCRRLCDEMRVVLVAGSHVVTMNSEARRVYRDLGFPLAGGSPVAGPSVSVGQALCVVLLPGGKPLAFAKAVRSKWEMSLVTGDTRFHVFEMDAKGGKIEVQILICIEALEGESTGREKRSQPRVVVIPAFTPDVAPFHHFGPLSVLRGHCTLFANNSEFGGSKAFARCDATRVWFADLEGSSPLPLGAEALVVLEADLEAQFEIRRSTKEHYAVTELSVYPILYTQDSVEARRYAELVESLPAEATLEEVVASVRPFTSLARQVFPRLLQNKLEQFCNQVVPAGAVSAAEAKSWLKALVVDDTPSTSRLRHDLSTEAITVVHELQMSGQYTTRASDLAAVYGQLTRKRSELLPLINLTQAQGRAGGAQVERVAPPADGSGPFLDRDSALDKIRAFMSQDYQCAFVLSGMRGIGKSSLVAAAFRQAITPGWRKVRLWLTEGVSAPRFLAQLGFACYLPLPDDLDLSSPERQNDMGQRVVSYLSNSPPAVVVLEDFHFLLNASGEIEDRTVRNLFKSLLEAGGRNRTKYFLVCDVAPRLGAEAETRCVFYSLRGLEKEYTARLLSYWFQFHHEAPAGQLPGPSDRLLTVLGGHPLATKIAARLWAEHPSQDISRDMSLFRELRDTIVPFILGKLSLTDAETELMSFASILRIPAPRELFVNWKGEVANDLLNSLASQYLLESGEEGYQLHPLVRDYFFQNLSVVQSIGLHRVAGKFYSDWFEKQKKTTGRLVPDLLGEAVHHYLGALEIKRVRHLAFFRTELRPIARSHYQKEEFEAARKEYSILVELDDKDADAHYHLGRIYARENRWDDAELHFGKAVSLLPNACWVLQGYAAAKRHADMLDEAWQLLERSLKINPRHSATLVEMGRLCEIRGDEASAEEYYERAIDADPNNFRAYYRLARLLNKAGSFREAFEMISAAVATNPRDPQASVLLAELRAKLEKAGEDTG
jgi:tetratricopeptide (TPR) repeat protein